MAHSLILGVTESGKTTLSKRIAEQARERGIGVIVLDPLNDPEWPADFRTADKSEFLSAVWRSRKCFVFVDEAGEMVSHHNPEMMPLTTRGRHWGHNVFLISQRAEQINRTVRDQCARLYMFALAHPDCKTLSKEFNSEELLEGTRLPKGHFFKVGRFSPAERMKLWED